MHEGQRSNVRVALIWLAGINRMPLSLERLLSGSASWPSNRRGREVKRDDVMQETDGVRAAQP